MDVAAWLRDLGLARYEQAFRDSDLDADVLPDLTEVDLEKLGISLGHRKKLLRAIAALHPRAGSGADQSSATAIEGSSAGATHKPDAERRQLTVLFVDLVGSTTLAARLDPEDLREVMRVYHAVCAEVIGRFEGHIAKYLGDGVLAYFGWPRAHEDDAERAVRAGLALVDAIARLDAHSGVRLQARAGIATGMAVVGDLIGEGASREAAVVGEVPNLAARLQALAEPGAVVIGEATRRLVAGVFELDDLGAQHLKGFAEPLPAWRVAGEGRAEGRFEARQMAALTPLVGRAEEIALLLRRWQQAKDGEGHVVLVSGEPGIGKSRLVREVRARLEDEPHVRLLYQCSPHHTTSPLHPLIEQLERAADFAHEDQPEAKLKKLEALLTRGTDRLEQVVPLIAALLGVPTEGRYPALDLTPQRQKQLTLAALVEQLEGLAAAQPVVLAYEDMHWSDPTTQELLGLTIERLQRLPVLLLITCRPEFSPPWPTQPHVSALALSRLGRREGVALVEWVVKDKPLPAEVAAQIVAKTDGVPLFVEELTKTVLESGLLKDAGDHYELSGSLPPLAIPSTLHDSLLARLDRLAPVKEIAQIGAALGREFSHGLLAAVAGRPEAELQAALDQLVAAELVYRRGTAPDVTYSFKHALVQDTAYGTLLKSRRQHLHARITKVLQTQFPETAETQPEVLAHHCMQAGLTDRAVDYWIRAGQHSLARSGMIEAGVQLTRGLEVLGSLADSLERDERELNLRVPLGKALIATKGFSAPEVGSVYARAHELCRGLLASSAANVDGACPRELRLQTTDAPQLMEVLLGLFAYNLHCRKADLAHEIAEEMLLFAERQHNAALQVAGHQALGASSMWRGNLASALAHFEEGLSLCNKTDHDGTMLLGVSEPRVLSLGLTACILSWQGYLEKALARSKHSLAAAQELSHAFTLAHALHLNAWFHQCRGERQIVRERAAANKALSAEHGFANWHAEATIFHGWAVADGDEIEAGIAEMREGLAADQATGIWLQIPQFMGLLADAYTRANNPAEALDLLDESLALADRIDEGWFEPELYRLKGEALVALSPERATEAETCHQQALAVARHQGARLWELRAATSLARLWTGQGEHAQARDLLAPVYGWFTEGFETRDLKDAKALLDELA